MTWLTEKLLKTGHIAQRAVQEDTKALHRENVHDTLLSTDFIMVQLKQGIRSPQSYYTKFPACHLQNPALACPG